MENNVKEYPIDCYQKDGSLIDPGKGYRLLKMGEQVKEGDEYFNSDFEEWVPDEGDFPIVEDCDAPVRRKLETGILEDNTTHSHNGEQFRFIIYQDRESFLKHQEEIQNERWFALAEWGGRKHIPVLYQRTGK